MNESKIVRDATRATRRNQMGDVGKNEYEIQYWICGIPRRNLLYQRTWIQIFFTVASRCDMTQKLVQVLRGALRRVLLDWNLRRKIFFADVFNV